MAELVDLAALPEPGKFAALADDDDREVLAARVPAADAVGDFLEVDRLLRDEDHVGAARDAARDCDPPGMASHDLDHHHAVVRLGRRVQPVDRLRRDRNGGVESEGVVGAGEVVVDRLRDADDRERVLAVEAGRDAQRVLSADRDERVEPAVGEVLQHLVDPAVELERVGTGRADDRASAGQDSRDRLRAEIAEIPVDEAAPAFERRDGVPPSRIGCADDRADHRVQSGAIAAAREDADCFGHS